MLPPGRKGPARVLEATGELVGAPVVEVALAGLASEESSSCMSSKECSTVRRGCGSELGGGLEAATKTLSNVNSAAFRVAAPPIGGKFHGARWAVCKKSLNAWPHSQVMRQLTPVELSENIHKQSRHLSIRLLDPCNLHLAPQKHRMATVQWQPTGR